MKWVLVKNNERIWSKVCVRFGILCLVQRADFPWEKLSPEQMSWNPFFTFVFSDIIRITIKMIST